MPFDATDFLREVGPRLAFKAEHPTQPLLRDDTGVQGGGGARGIAGEHPITGSEAMLVTLPTSFSSWLVVLDAGTASLDATKGGLTGCILEELDVIGTANGIEL